MLRKAAYQSRCIYAQMTAKCRALLMSRNFAISAKLDKSYAIKASGARKKNLTLNHTVVQEQVFLGWP